MNLRSVSGVARPLDFGYPTNRWIVVIMTGVFIVFWGIGGVVDGVWIGGVLDAVLAAVAVLLAWALCRELDPDLEISALIAAGICALVMLVLKLLDLQTSSIAPLLVVLLGMRVLNRTTGLPATASDIAAILLLGIWVAQEWGALFLLLGIGALALDGAMAPMSRVKLLVAAAIAVLIGIWVLAGPIPALAPPDPVAGMLAIALAALLVPTMRAAGSIQARADDTDEPLMPQRIRAGQGLAVVAGVTAAAWQDWDGYLNLWPLWAAVIAAGGYRLARPYLGRYGSGSG
ncbi:MAG: hypothetical protein WBG92_10285 [Thiohalocapsa sp.]